LNGVKLPTTPSGFNLKVKSSGNYQVRATTTYPKGPTCVSPLSNEIIYQLPVGNGLVTYPNPVSGEMVVQSQYDLVGSSYHIYGLDGREILQGVIDDSIEFRINISSLNSGTYKLVILLPSLETIQKTIVIDNH
jgi:hypothetical protein